MELLHNWQHGPQRAQAPDPNEGNCDMAVVALASQACTPGKEPRAREPSTETLGCRSTYEDGAGFWKLSLVIVVAGFFLCFVENIYLEWWSPLLPLNWTTFFFKDLLPSPPIFVLCLCSVASSWIPLCLVTKWSTVVSKPWGNGGIKWLAYEVCSEKCPHC